ncbi:MAG: universal stress protein [Dehalococcoidales bacterium]|nr:universal stress protein [Dehalococcoidales bacterium]
MEERILIPLDGSKVGEAALEAVIRIIEKFKPDIKVEITLLQVLTSLTHYVIAGEASVQVLYTDNELAQIHKEVTDYLMNAGKELENKGARIAVRISTGNAAEEIIKAAEETDATLIAMSTHGRSGISRWALGSVAERVLRMSSRPVLVIRAKK